MSMSIEVRSLDSADGLARLKQQYMGYVTGPLDGMWLCGFVPAAQHFAFYGAGDLLGYACVNDEGDLIQFFCDPLAACRPEEVFGSLFDGPDSPAGELQGVFVSTAEPRTLTLCLDRFPRFEVHALMYQRSPLPIPEPADTTPVLRPLAAVDLQAAVDFAVASLGAPADWLRGYYANLIERKELFGAWRSASLLALGESRGYDAYQQGFADLGVIVAPAERGCGHATQVLRQLARRNESLGLQSICSTERSNPAAQRAIERAGFSAGHRILRFQP